MSNQACCPYAATQRKEARGPVYDESCLPRVSPGTRSHVPGSALQPWTAFPLSSHVCWCNIIARLKVLPLASGGVGINWPAVPRYLYLTCIHFNETGMSYQIARLFLLDIFRYFMRLLAPLVGIVIDYPSSLTLTREGVKVDFVCGGRCIESSV